jgi:hypothetical protein
MCCLPLQGTMPMVVRPTVFAKRSRADSVPSARVFVLLGTQV